MSVTLVLEELLSDFISKEKEVIGLKFKTSRGLVVFWGEFGGLNRNVAALRHQKLPVMIDLNDPELCAPTEWERKNHHLLWSVPSDATIFIYNDF